MFQNNSILLCVCLVLIYFLGYGDAKENTTFAKPCGPGTNTTCFPITRRYLSSMLNKSFEAFRFKLKLISITKCNTPTNKLDPNYPVELKHTIRRITRNITMLDLEINVKQKVGPLSVSFYSYILKQNAVKDLIHRIDKAGCSHRLMIHLRAILQLDNVLNDKCFLEVGTKKIENMNFDSIAWVTARTVISPGIYIVILEYSSPNGIVLCNKINMEAIERRQQRL